MRGTKAGRGSHGLRFRAINRSVLTAFAAAIATSLAGAGVASADTHTGDQFKITCDGTVYYAVSPTSPAAVAQDVSSTQVFVLAYGALFAPNSFPAGKTQPCDLVNLTENIDFGVFPFLIQGAPAPLP
jgi:hypothetical protein